MEKYGVEMPTVKVVKNENGKQVVIASDIYMEEAKELQAANPGSLILPEK